jgi:O-antigen ligase
VGVEPVLDRFEVLERPDALETSRLGVWRDTVTLIRDYPLVGTGLGTFGWVSQHYQTTGFPFVRDHAHNDYLEFAAEIGIPGAVLLFGASWVLLIQVAQRSLASERVSQKIVAAGCAGAMAAILIHGITDFNLQIPANAFVFSWIAGTAAFLVSASSRSEVKAPEWRPIATDEMA